jgi:hypothetical protein
MSAWGTRHRARYGLTSARPQKPELPANTVEMKVASTAVNSNLPRLLVAGEEIRNI